MERDFARLLRTSDKQQVLAQVHDDDEGVRLTFSATLEGLRFDMSVKFDDDQSDRAFAALDLLTEPHSADEFLKSIKSLTRQS